MMRMKEVRVRIMIRLKEFGVRTMKCKEVRVRIMI